MWTYEARVMRIIDGDTIDVMIDVGFSQFTKQRLRLNFIDTPERGQEGFTEATNHLKLSIPPGRMIIIRSVKKDSFGRWLATLWLSEKELERGDRNSINQELLDLGLAVPYKK